MLWPCPFKAPVDDPAMPIPILADMALIAAAISNPLELEGECGTLLAIEGVPDTLEGRFRNRFDTEPSIVSGLTCSGVLV